MHKLLLTLLLIMLSQAGYGLDKLEPPDLAASSKRYVADSPAACDAIQFTCAESELVFFDENGCGCATASNKRYVEQNPTTCLTLTLTCEASEWVFFDQQGCGCVQPTEATDCNPK